MNNIALSVALATAPSSAFEDLRQRPRFWFPLLLIIVTTSAIWYWYYSVVDFEWFKQTVLSNTPDVQALPADQRDAVMGMYTRNMLKWGSTVAIAFVTAIVFLLSALYLWLAAKVTKLPSELRFKHWFAFGTWASLPLVLGNLVSAILLMLSDSPQISPGTMAPLGLNELLVHVPFGNPAQGVLDSLSIPAFLSWALMIIGVKVWSQRSWIFSTVFILLPAVVIYGIWAFFAFR
jgi:hypothetical protein